jgi:endonuclease-3
VNKQPESTDTESPKATHKWNAAEKIPHVIAALNNYYGMAPKPAAEPIEILIRGILSQNTSDTNSNRAYRSLLTAFNSWDEINTATSAEIEKAIRRGGLASQKARTIKAALAWIKQNGNSYSLDFLEEMGVHEAEKALLSINGVGIKTARLVLLFGFDRPVFVVDTHVFRVAKRIGLIPQKSSRAKAHKLLDELVPDDAKYNTHMNLIKHGRETCMARSPHCPECPVFKWCLFGHTF